MTTILNNRLVIILLSIGTLLLIPFIAMQFTDQVEWSPIDFLIMGILLLGTGLSIEWVWRKCKNAEHRLVLWFVILIVFLLIWAELAVGIFGTPFAGS